MAILSDVAPSPGGCRSCDERSAGVSVSGMGPVWMPAVPRQAAGTPLADRLDVLVHFSS